MEKKVNIDFWITYTNKLDSIDLVKLKWKHSFAGIGLWYILTNELHKHKGKLDYDLKYLTKYLDVEEELLESVLRDFNLFKVDEEDEKNKTITSDLVQETIDKIDASVHNGKIGQLYKKIYRNMRALGKTNESQKVHAFETTIEDCKGDLKELGVSRNIMDRHIKNNYH